MRLIFSILLIFLSSVSWAQAVSCASSSSGDVASGSLSRQLGIHSVVHGSSLSSALKIIHSGALLSSRQVAKDSGAFASVGDNDPAPLKSIFLQAMYNEKSIPALLTEFANFDVVFIFRHEVLDRYAFYAKPAWNYDLYASCVSSDVNLKNGSLEDMVMNYNNQNRAKAAEKNEIMIKSSTGVSLTFLAGVYVRPQAQDKIVQALGEVGFSSEEVAQLLNWKKTYSYNFPFSELQNSDVVEICQKNKGSKIFWEDLTGNQPYIEAGEWFSAADGKSLQDISKWLTGQELLVRLVNRYRLRMRVTRVYEANGALYLDYTEVESPALKSKVAFDDLLQVGFISSGVLDQYCQSVVSEGSF